MILYRYSKADGSYAYPRGKTEALRDCRRHAKLTPNSITLAVEEVELRPLTGKTMILALLNGEDVIAVDEEGELKATIIAEVKGKIKMGKRPKPLPQPKTLTNGTGPKVTAYAQESDADGQEYVNVYTKHGFRLVKISHLQPGMKILTNRTDGPACRELPGNW